MKRLWAPWRMEFIAGHGGAQPQTGGNCIFCKPALERFNQGNEDGLVLYKGSTSAVLLNKFPYNNGHLLVFPARHTGNIEDLTPQESLDLFSLIQKSVSILNLELKPDGFNIGLNLGKAAGAGIAEHIHFHIVPRWNGDNNFMPVVAETKVMPEHLKATCDKLKPYFDKL